MLGLFIVPFNDAVAKALSTDLNIMEIIWSRFFGHFLLLVPLVFYFKGKKEFINKNTNQQIFRGILIFGGTSFFFLSIKYIPLVNALCLYLIAPIIVVFFSSTVLKEKISLNVWVSIIIATVGIVIMAIGNTEKNSLIGFLFGITSSIGFSVFSVSLRWRKETPKFTTVAVAGLFCFVFASFMILINKQPFFATSYNSAMFSLHGIIVCFGLILYSIGSKAIPAAELTLLSLTEVIGGIFWVWLPLFGINEVPSTNTIVGGFFLFISLIYYSLIMRWNKRYIALN